MTTFQLHDSETAPEDAKPILEQSRQAFGMIAKRGNVDKADLDAFFSAGYGQQQVLEVILGLAQKTISNYVNHIAETPLDQPFQPLAWQRT